jgi:hypothetical protein
VRWTQRAGHCRDVSLIETVMRPEADEIARQTRAGALPLSVEAL